ncbi:hypothetical protein [Duganella sp. FT27W]|uniref:hypothetical protein n=1 Tax=Duganella sp. FT27W TaxID=2654636 RepID=UPI00128B8722|nr:hypothetical protein [Duganella sp. FT27W]MPQ56302.1 hypothetical protein [Duganella sp. FT27W]
MPLTYKGIMETGQMLVRVDTTAKRRVKSALVQKAREIQAKAVRMAPRDVSNLEKAIKVRGEGSMLRDDAGRFTRAEVEIYIDETVPVPERPGKMVGDYAYEIHTHLTPAGTMQLGPKSRAKQDGQTEVVGGGFMERAVAEIDGAIDAALAEALASIF